jgi:hypothetical protein
MCASSLTATYGDADVMNTQQQHGASPLQRWPKQTEQSSNRHSGPPTHGLGSPEWRGHSGCATSPTRRASSRTACTPSQRRQSASLLTWWRLTPSWRTHTELCRRLLAAHHLTNTQWVEQLFSLQPLATQKLLELLAEMLCLCLWGQEKKAFLNCLFLNKQPKELRILFSEGNMADKQALGAGGDLFAAHNSKHAHDVVAVVAAVSLLEQEGEETMVAAVPPGASSGQRVGWCRQRGVEGKGEAWTRWQWTAWCHMRSRPGWRLGCSSVTSATGPRQGHAVAPAPGLETSWPGAAQLRCRRPADPQQDLITNRRLWWTPVLPTASPQTALLYLPWIRSCFTRRVSSFLAGETAWFNLDSRIRIFLGNFY